MIDITNISEIERHPTNRCAAGGEKPDGDYIPLTSRSAEARLHQLAMVDTFIAENRRPDAIALLERITRTKKEGPGVQLKLGELYLETAQLDKCLKTLEEAER